MIAADHAPEDDRLLRALMHVDCDPHGRKWNLGTCHDGALLTVEIDRLTHSYVEPEVI